jgi:radical SAM-linked protein
VPDQPEQQAPPVQRLRIRYAKRGRLRFASHRDFSRAFERALVRAGVPMAYSSGFNPHPRISYAGAAPTGAASEAEYLEIGLREEADAGEVLDRLDHVLPDGLDVLEVVAAPTVPPGAPRGSLADLLTGSHWTVEVRADPPRLAAAVTAFLAQAEVPVERMTKKGLRAFDCRAAVVRLEAVEGTPATLDLVLRHAVPAVRPDDVLTGLVAVTPGLRLDQPLLTRLSQGVLDERTGEIADPLA